MAEIDLDDQRGSRTDDLLSVLSVLKARYFIQLFRVFYSLFITAKRRYLRLHLQSTACLL